METNASIYIDGQMMGAMMAHSYLVLGRGFTDSEATKLIDTIVEDQSRIPDKETGAYAS